MIALFGPDSGGSPESLAMERTGATHPQKDPAQLLVGAQSLEVNQRRTSWRPARAADACDFS